MAETTKTLNVRFQQKIDTAENWAASSIILLAGEIAVESELDKGTVITVTFYSNKSYHTPPMI